MIVVHHLEHSRSERIVWLLEELGVAYEIKRYARDPKTMLAPEALMRIHPLGKAPVVVDDDGSVLIESGAIIETLISRHGAADGATAGLRPDEGTPERLRYTTYLHFAEGSLMPLLVLRLMFSTMGEKAPLLARPLVRAIMSFPEKLYVGPNIRRTFDFLEHELAARSWFAGDTFTAADIQMGFVLDMARRRGDLNGRWPKLVGFLERIAARTAYQRAKSRIDE